MTSECCSSAPQVVCLDAETQRPVQVVSPIDPNTHEAEIANLQHGAYLVYLEIHVSLSSRTVHGSTDMCENTGTGECFVIRQSLSFLLSS